MLRFVLFKLLIVTCDEIIPPSANSATNTTVISTERFTQRLFGSRNSAVTAISVLGNTSRRSGKVDTTGEAVSAPTSEAGLGPTRGVGSAGRDFSATPGSPFCAIQDSIAIATCRQSICEAPSEAAAKNANCAIPRKSRGKPRDPSTARFDASCVIRFGRPTLLALSPR
jgi:hypothetical protein